MTKSAQKSFTAAIATIVSSLEFPQERVDRRSGETKEVNAMAWAPASFIGSMIWKAEQLMDNQLNGRYERDGKLARWGEGAKQYRDKWLEEAPTLGAPKGISQQDLDDLEQRRDDCFAQAAVFRNLSIQLRAAFEEISGGEYYNELPELEIRGPKMREASSTKLSKAQFEQEKAQMIEKATKMGLEGEALDSFVQRWEQAQAA